MRLECAMTYVKDFPRMKEFYGRLFRAQPVNTEHTERWALFDSVGTHFALHAIPADHASEIEISSPPRAREGSPVKLVFAVDNVPAERARLEALGVTMLPRPWQQPDEACDGVDPEGNIFQISRVRR